MSALDILHRRLLEGGVAPAIIVRGHPYSYRELYDAIAFAEHDLRTAGCRSTVVALVADYGLQAIAHLVALWRLGNVVALLTDRVSVKECELIQITEAKWIIRCGTAEGVSYEQTGIVGKHALLSGLNSTNTPGFVIFSSGSTGRPKASVHQTMPLLEKHVTAKRSLRSISFLLFDHIGGLNTLLYVLFNRGTLVIPVERRPESVAQAIDIHRVQALTTSPTFLNLLIVSGALTRYDLTSLQVVNYGTEPISESVLGHLTRALPKTRFSQAYGLTETGIVPTQSESSTSNWMRIGAPGCDVRIVDGLLEIRNATTMLGYLNDEDPFTEDGYFKTGDAVLQKGDLFQIIGRRSDLINIGGEKVYPAEIERVLKELDGVVDVAVCRGEHPLVGHMVTATFRLARTEPVNAFRQRLYSFCAGKLPPARIPRKIRITLDPLHSERFKKIRSGGDLIRNEEV